ncbi:MAG: alkaline phosphatase family protein [Candidatus Promineifilaceae bacterium]
MRTLIVGIDGATFDLVRPWAAAGHLPNLARLMEEGAHGPLASTLPPVTSPAWPSFMTGCNPGKHGVFDFIQAKGNDFSLVNSSQIRQPTLWQRLSAAGYRAGVLNVPVTYPPQPINGFMVTGILSPTGGQICYPADLIGRYQAELGDYRYAPRVQYKPGNEAEFIADLYDLVRAQAEWALKLMAAEPWDVLMVHFISLDILMHALWRFMDRSHPRHEPGPFEHALREGYQLVDDYLGRLMEQAAADHVFVMSDHGFGPLHKIVNLNIFLMQAGFLKLRGDLLTRLRAGAFRRGLTPAGVYHLLERLGLQNLAARASKETRNQIVAKLLSFDSVDWRRTRAYSLGHVGQIYLNLAGREAQGVVRPEEYDGTLKALIEALGELRDEAGRPLVSQIISRAEAHHGPFAADGPDLHLVLDDYKMIAFPLFATNGEVVTEQIRGDSGCHRREGVFIAWGAEVGAGLALAEADITDVAPTLLHLLGRPVPAVMDGRVIESIFKRRREVAFEEEGQDDGYRPAGEALSVEETAQIEARLRSLGYL